MARTEARLDATGAVARRGFSRCLGAGELRTDWARVDATTEAEIERQAASDDAEAAKDAAAGCGAFAGAPDATSRVPARRSCISVRDSARFGTGEAVAARCGPRPSALIAGLPEAVLALSASYTLRERHGAAIYRFKSLPARRRGTAWSRATSSAATSS